MAGAVINTCFAQTFAQACLPQAWPKTQDFQIRFSRVDQRITEFKLAKYLFPFYKLPNLNSDQILGNSLFSTTFCFLYFWNISSSNAQVNLTKQQEKKLKESNKFEPQTTCETKKASAVLVRLNAVLALRCPKMKLNYQFFDLIFFALIFVCSSPFNQILPKALFFIFPNITLI